MHFRYSRTLGISTLCLWEPISRVRSCLTRQLLMVLKICNFLP
uniref:Uncharacterized protein n=1 Tax=Arundo donax TaxID=35708 RepID=A0A0A9AV62_ARUDO